LPEEEFFEDVERSTPESAKARFSEFLATHRDLGFVLFSVVAALALVFFTALAALTALTVPTVDMADKLMPQTTDAERLKAYADLRSAWLQQTTTLAQLLVFGSLVPVLSTIIGYVLGSETRRKTNSADS